MRCTLRFLVTLSIATLLSVPTASGQTAVTGSIAGTVRDNTKAVLPGVTVEASSPQLIEKVRSAVTDGQGLFTIVNLPPGVYTVTFALTGFNTVIQNGIQVAAGVAVPVNALLNLGTATETITVTGAAPVVDLRNTNQQAVLSREILDSVPTAQNFAGLAALTVGVSGARDVGGSSGDGSAPLTASGGTGDGAYQLDGLAANSISIGGSSRRYQMNQAAVQEVVLNTRGAGADTETGGVTANVVVKEGGNTFRGSFDAEYTGDGLYNRNLSQELMDRGLNDVNDLRKIYAVGGGFGGPIKRDRVWFYAAYRNWNTEQYLAGQYYNGDTDPRRLFYTPDLNRRAFSTSPVKDFSGRITYQATEKMKFSIFDSNQTSCLCKTGQSAATAPEATPTLNIGPSLLLQGTWNYSPSSRVLIELGSAVRSSNVDNVRQPGVLPTDISIQEQFPRTFRYNAVFTTAGLLAYGNQGRGTGWTHTGALNYITGTHQVKTGFSLLTGNSPSRGELNDPPISYRFNNRTPNLIMMAAFPSAANVEVNRNLALYAQDRWTIGRATLNYGVRYDSLNSRVPAQARPGGMFLGELQFDAVENVPNWKDISPRVGATYDLFGDAKTAIKGQLGRYVIGEASNYASANSPANRLSALVSRTWNDWDTDYVPDCDLTNFAANGLLGGPTGTQPECGAVSSSTFGTPVFTSTYDPELLEGWFTRPYQWTGSVGVEHQLLPRVGIDVTYHRTWRGNTTVTDNRAITPDDFDPFCVMAPTDSALGSVSGSEICGLYDRNRETFGRTDNFITHTKNFGDDSQIYNGVDVALSARFAQGGLFSGGGSFGKTVEDTCAAIVDDPSTRFCRTESGVSDIKLAVSYPLKWDIQAAVTYQNLLGPAYNATRPFPNSAILPSLGRNLGACAPLPAVCNSNVTVTLLEPNQQREDRAQQVDVRLSKLVRIGNLRIRGRFDVYNLLNADDVLAQTESYGSLWRVPSSVLAGRTFKFGTQVEF